MITARTLPPEEFTKLQAVGGPLATVADGALQAAIGPNPTAFVNVVEEDGVVVGYWVTFATMHAEPLYIAPEARDQAGVARALLEQTITHLQSVGIQSVFAIIGDDVVSTVGPMAESLGLQPLPGRTYGGLL